MINWINHNSNEMIKFSAQENLVSAEIRLQSIRKMVSEGGIGSLSMSSVNTDQLGVS